MKQMLKRVLVWSVIGWVAAEIVYVILKGVLAPTPLHDVGTEQLLLFKSQIALAFLLAPLMLSLVGRALQDRTMMTMPRFVIAGVFLSAGLGAHLAVIHAIFGKPRPAILPPYELFTNSFYFFRWGFCGLLLGVGVIALYSLFVNKGLETTSATAA